MKLQGEGKLLRVFIGEADTIDGKSFFEALVLAAREEGLAGATVLRGVEGYGAESRVIHTAKILRLSEDLPIVVEIVDTEERIRAFMPSVERMVEAAHCGALITLEKAEVIRYSPASASSPATG